MMPKVLMLGWEYPPQVTGGLGVATQGLSEALAAYVDLNLILPKSVKASDAVTPIGLDQVRLSRLRRQSSTLNPDRLHDLGIYPVGIELDPYGQLNLEGLPDAPRPEALLIPGGEAWQDHLWQMGRFRLPEMYGHDLLVRVAEYAEITAMLAQQLEFDLIYAHDWMTGLAGLLIKAQSGSPLIFHVHSTAFDRQGPEHRGWINQLEHQVMHQADLVVAVSDYTAQLIHRFYQLPLSSILKVHNGISQQAAYRTIKTFPEKLVVFLGRLTYQKGPDLFFEAALKVLGQIDKVRFIVAGEGEMLPDLIQRCNTHRVGDRFHFAGFLPPDEIQDLLAMADVLVMPSRSEPFGLVALEAIQMGVPCIITPQAGVGEVLPNLLVARPEDSESLAHYIVALLQYPALAQAVLRLSRADMEGLNWDAAAIRLVDAFRRLDYA